MATITSAASGNFSAGATWVGGVVPTTGDDAVAANGHTVVIDVDVTVAKVTQSGTGKFTLGNGRKLTANVEANAGTFTSGGTVECICGVGESATITGNITGVSSTANNIAGVVISGVGSLTINGSVTGSAGNGSSEANGSAGVYTNVTCTITINGAATGGSGNHKRGVQAGSSSNAAITVNGNVGGGSGQQSYGIYHTGASGTITATATTIQGGGGTNAYGIYHTGASGTITATATTIQGGGGNTSHGILHIGTSGTITATATTIQGGGGVTSYGITNTGASGNITSSGEVKANGTATFGILSSATSSANGVFHSGSITDSTAGRAAINTTFLRVASGTGTTTHATPGSPTGSANPRFSPDQILGVPAASNVRSGTVYGSPGTLTGTLAVPAANQVAAGVAVDNTVGTAVLTASTLRSAIGLASANLDTQLTGISNDINNITVDNAAIADAVWDEAYSGHAAAGTFGKLMNTIRKSNLSIDGTVTSAITPTTLTFSSDIAATTSAYAHAVLLFVSGPLEGENSPIVSYNSTNGVFVLEEPLTSAPTAGDEFVVIAGSHVHAIADIQSGLALQSTSLAIKAKTDLISTGNVQFVSPVALNGSIATPIFIGDDYKASIGRAFEWNITARTGYSAATATCRFGGYSEQTADAWSVSGSVTDNGNGTWKLSFDLPKATTSGLSDGFYRWSVELVNPGGDEVTEVYNSTANRLVEVRAKQT